jgi:hypothetical protein
MSRPVAIAASTLLAIAANFASAQSLDPAAGAASEALVERCGSVVIVHCTDRPTTPAPQSRRSDDGLKNSQRKFRQRRLGYPNNADPRPDETISVTADPVYDPMTSVWQEFGEKVASARTPECLHAGEDAGLFAAILVPLMAMSGKCR